jgi:hypothetical protein
MCHLNLSIVFLSHSKQLDYKKQYEANKAYWKWTPDRPDFIQAAKSSLQQSDVREETDMWPVPVLTVRALAPADLGSRTEGSLRGNANS